MRSPAVISAVLMLILLCAPLAVLTGAASEPEQTRESTQPLFIEYSTTAMIRPGEDLSVVFDPEAGTLRSSPPQPLPPPVRQAIDQVPEWLKINLTNKFYELSPNMRGEFANLILNTPDERCLDEVAFCVAHMPVENLENQYFFPELLYENAEMVYANDEFLDYVEILEKDDYTTVVYKNYDNVSVELPRDYYYFYIVHPKISDDLPTYVDPDYDYTQNPPFDRNYGTAPPNGVFWRTWFTNHNDSAQYIEKPNGELKWKWNPFLKDKVENAETIWDAVDGINSWVSNSMVFDSDFERPVQPVRIYRKHMGRCGEHQDLRVSAARTMLIPTLCCNNVGEDHVWAEFWDGRWIHWDGAYDKPLMYENGWGKTISSVWDQRPDGHIWSVTNKYSEQICNFTATVLDDRGRPVDGAKVRIMTEALYNPDMLTTTYWATTDYTGKVRMDLGEHRNYWAAVSTEDLGEVPRNGNVQIITNAEPWKNYTYTFNLPESAPSLDVDAVPSPAGPGNYVIDVEYRVESNILRSENHYTGDHAFTEAQGGNIDFFITDNLNFNLYSNGLGFQAFEVDERSTMGQKTFHKNDNDEHYFVLSNGFSQESTKLVNITIKVYSGVVASILIPEKGSDYPLDGSQYVSGSAFAPNGVDKVEVRLDSDGPWLPAGDLSEDDGPAYMYWDCYLGIDGVQPGAHTIYAKATEGENEFIASVNFVLEDVTPPVLNIDSPVEAQTFQLDEFVYINGSLTDDVMVTEVLLKIDQDHANFTSIIDYLKDGVLHYYFRANDLSLGYHELEISPRDSAGNMVTVTRTIEVVEQIAPRITIASPKADSIHYQGSSVVVEGKATDNDEIRSLSIGADSQKKVEISGLMNENGRWEYEFDAGSLTDGVHTINLKAIDPSGNEGTASVDIIVDGNAPSVSITSPANGLLISAGASMLVKGRVLDSSGIDKLILTLGDTKVDITSSIVGDTWSYSGFSTLSLGSGTHTITAKATDMIGMSKTASVNLLVDSTAPIVDIKPIYDPVPKGTALTVSGTVEDDMGLAKATLEYNGVVIDITDQINSGQWSLTLDSAILDVGYFYISLTAVDNVGNVAETNSRIDVVLPELDVEQPEDEYVDEQEEEDEDKEDSGLLAGTDGPLLFFLLGFAIVLILVCIGLFVLRRK